MASLSVHGTITEANLSKAIEETRIYGPGPHRLALSKQAASAMNELGWNWSLE